MRHASAVVITAFLLAPIAARSEDVARPVPADKAYVVGAQEEWKIAASHRLPRDEAHFQNAYSRKSSSIFARVALILRTHAAWWLMRYDTNLPFSITART